MLFLLITVNYKDIIDNCIPSQIVIKDDPKSSIAII